jgi:threonine/homoserine/homoserine lactone efflux protein
MQNTELLITVITAVLTIFSPLAIARAKNESWSKTVRVAVPIIVSLVLATIYLVARGQLALVTPDDWLQAILAVYGLQQLAYTTILRWWATVLERVGQTSSDDAPEHRA